MMTFSVSAAAPQDVISDLLGMIAFEEDLAAWSTVPPIPLRNTDPHLLRWFQEAISDQRFTATFGETIVVPTHDRMPARRIAIVGAGRRPTDLMANLKHPAAALARLANGLAARTLWVGIPGPVREPRRQIEVLVEGLVLGCYHFDKYLGAEKRKVATLDSVILQIASGTAAHDAQTAIEKGLRVARAVAAARDLVNEPAGTLTPKTLAARASADGVARGLVATVLDRDESRRLGMELFLAVAQGSSEEPQFVHLAWRPNAPKKRIVLVGKGVTFDSGGLSLKTTEGMLEMKSDMAGAAAVLCAIGVAAEENLPIEIHALAACTENMPSGNAYKLGDIIRSMSGKTVEITNTDAEGRLTLADALTFGLTLAPDVILDFATLTGACVIALGPHVAGVMTNDNAAAERWLAAARVAGEEMWPLPLPARQAEQLKSEIADLRNSGSRWGGALTAGLFLKEFVGAVPWIHVDIAGPATTDKEWGSFTKGGTGFGVASIVEYLRNVAHSP
jgi:leucyl aminopeptidase